MSLRFKKVLIIKMRYIGDVVLSTPVMRAVKEAYPEACVSVLVNKGTEDVLYNNQFLNEIIVFDRQMGVIGQWGFIRGLKKMRFDIAIDITRADRPAYLAYLAGIKMRVGFRGNNLFRDRFLYNVLIEPVKGHRVDRDISMVEGLGVKVNDRTPFINITPGEIEEAKGILKENGLFKPYIVVQPTARKWYKAWPEERFDRLINEIFQNYPLQVVVTGEKGDVSTCEAIVKAADKGTINMAGKITLRQLSAIIKGAILFIGNDSAPLHIAAAVGTPTIGLFGPTRWEDLAPRGDIHTAVSKDGIDCRPCGHDKDCIKGDLNCMRLIGFDEVIDVVKRKLQLFGISPFLKRD